MNCCISRFFLMMTNNQQNIKAAKSTETPTKSRPKHLIC